MWAGVCVCVSQSTSLTHTLLKMRLFDSIQSQECLNSYPGLQLFTCCRKRSTGEWLRQAPLSGCVRLFPLMANTFSVPSPDSIGAVRRN